MIFLLHAGGDPAAPGIIGSSVAPSIRE